MLKIYSGRENLNKEKFMYETIKQNGGKNFVLVPDQYTLEAERQALKYMECDVLLDTEVLSFSRMGTNLLANMNRNIVRIDSYGRYMQLAKIYIEREDEFKVFNQNLFRQSSSFLRLVNDFIAEAKLSDVTPADIMALAEDETLPDALRDKFSDLGTLYEKYEEAIAEKYTDSEDYIDCYKAMIPESEDINASDIWIYGFDSFTVKNFGVISALIANAKNVNVVLTDSREARDKSLFELPGYVKSVLLDCAKECGMDAEVIWIEDTEFAAKERAAQESGAACGNAQGVGVQMAAVPADVQAAGQESGSSEVRPSGIRALEQELFADSRKSFGDYTGISIVRCSDVYAEAESAASHVLHLLRDEKLRYRDIVVICNDNEQRIPLIKRAFEEHGIKLFQDSKRNILNSPLAVYVVALLQAAAGSFRMQDVIRLLKTGLTTVSADETEDLEIYMTNYRIKYNCLKTPFKYGASEYGDEGLAHLNEIREKALAIFAPVEVLIKEAETMGAFIEGYYRILCESPLLEHVQKHIKKQRLLGYDDIAEESEQIWAMIVGAFEQISELMGDTEFDINILAEILVAGLSEMEVGILPPTVDEILLGTMQRTRVSDVKALLVVGANEGILPLTGDEDSLFSPEEYEMISERVNLVDKTVKMPKEEKLAIYRNLSKPSQQLWISYADTASGKDGEELRPSEIVGSIKRIFPDLKEERDVLAAGKIEDIIGGRVNTIKHLTEALKTAKSGTRLHPEWEAVSRWTKEFTDGDFDRIVSGIYFDNYERPLSEEMAKNLYQSTEFRGTDDYKASPSRLERFSRCPFSHFITYGLRPKEERTYEAAGREIGDLHHGTMAEIAAYLTENDLWDVITDDEVKSLVSEIMMRKAAEYREGVFGYSDEDSYKLKRAISLSEEACLAMIEQHRAGITKESYFEIPFGRGKSIEPVVVQTEHGSIYIEGTIDRFDLTASDRVKIMDYKTGKELFNPDEVTCGYRLQLMTYLKAAQEQKREPAGAFYFLIQDSKADMSAKKNENIAEEISKEMKQKFKLNGIIVNDADAIREIAGDFDKESDVLSVSYTKTGELKGKNNSYIMSPAEFNEFQEKFDDVILDICERYISGDISISPMRVKSKTPCTYCSYKSICRFDLHTGNVETETNE